MKLINNIYSTPSSDSDSSSSREESVSEVAKPARQPSELLGLPARRPSIVPRALIPNLKTNADITRIGKLAIPVTAGVVMLNPERIAYPMKFAAISANVAALALPRVLRDASEINRTYDLETSPEGVEITKMLDNLLGSVPSSVQIRGKDYLADNWEVLRDRFFSLTNKDFEISWRAANSLAREYGLNQCFGCYTQEFSQYDKSRAMALLGHISGDRNIDADGSFEILSNHEYMMSASKLNDEDFICRSPATLFWIRQTPRGRSLSLLSMDEDPAILIAASAMNSVGIEESRYEGIIYSALAHVDIDDPKKSAEHKAISLLEKGETHRQVMLSLIEDFKKNPETTHHVKFAEFALGSVDHMPNAEFKKFIRGFVDRDA